MVTEVTAATELVVTVKVAVVEPADTVTLDGTCAADVLLLLSVTDAPPVGAAPESVTVPVEEVPPVTLEGLSDTDDSDTLDVVPDAFSATIAASQPLFGSVQLVL